MPNKHVRYQRQIELRGGSEPLPCAEALELVKKMAAVTSDRSYKNGRKRKDPDQTVELVMWLGIDSRQADQMLRGSISLPHGTGRTNRVIAFCDEDLADKAKSAGAVEAGADELVEKISKGWSDFDVAVAHPSMMGKVGKLGRILGPQGKMPSPKAGTVTPEVETAVREYVAGKLEYRNDSGGNIHLPVGKVSFSVDDLKENVEAAIAHMGRVKPSAAKGAYFKRVSVCATRTPSVDVAVGS
jgi:large subunit ribosomal protein L1